MSWGIGGDEDLEPDTADLNENKIVAALMSVLAVAFIAFITAVPHMDKDGSFRQTLSGLGSFGSQMITAGRGIVGGGEGGGLTSGPVRPNGLGPISMGMTAEEVRKLGPANFYRGAGGRLVANVRESNAAYTAWFTSGKQSGLVHKLRYDRIFPGQTADDALEFVKKGLGEPVNSRCTGGQSGGGVRECSLLWTAVEGIQMSAEIRQRLNDLGAVQTTVSVNAAASLSAKALKKEDN